MNELDIQVMKLDNAYNDSNSLFVNVNTFQKKLLEELERIINNLQSHWRGSDACTHINSLIEEYDNNVDSFYDLSLMTTFLSKYFVLLQRTRAKMSDITRVGDEEEAKYKAKTIDKIEETSEYFYDEQMKTDYDDICNLNKSYSIFINQISDDSQKLLENWRAGTGREIVKNRFDTYLEKTNKLYNKLIEFEEHMNTVITNESNIV